MKKWILVGSAVAAYTLISGWIQHSRMKKWILDREAARDSYGPTDGPVRIESIS